MVLRVFRTPDSEVLQRRKRLPPPSPNLAKLVLSQREKKCCLNPAPLSLRQMRDGLQGAGPHLLWEQDLAGLSLTDRRALGPGGQFNRVASPTSLTDGESQTQELYVLPERGGFWEPPAWDVGPA